MINRVYQLIRPSFFSIKYEDVSFYEEDTVVVRPNYLALCHADQRYFQGHVLLKFCRRITNGIDS